MSATVAVAGKAVLGMHMLAELERVDRAVEIRWSGPRVIGEVAA